MQLLCVCGGGEGLFENNFVRQFISLNLNMKRSFPWINMGKILLNKA